MTTDTSFRCLQERTNDAIKLPIHNLLISETLAWVAKRLTRGADKR